MLFLRSRPRTEGTQYLRQHPPIM